MINLQNTTRSLPLWQLLQVSDVLDLELASALSNLVPVLAWKPQQNWRWGKIAPGQEVETIPDPESKLSAREFPLPPGFHRLPLAVSARLRPSVLQRLLSQTSEPERSPLVCTIPHFAPVAEHWPGPVIYWLTDLIAEYAGANRDQIHRLDRRMCRAATLICPNSKRLAEYLIREAGCDPSRIQVIPNATRTSNLYPTPPEDAPALRPRALHSIDTLKDRPVAGVIGNLAGNMDWILLTQIIALTPWLSWVFVGPASMAIPDHAQRAARTCVMNHPHTHFVGRQPYAELASYARCFDVAVLPYKRCEPTYSGSSTRFYEHLAACRPMIATPGLEELTRKTSVLTLVDNAVEAAEALLSLKRQHFRDGRLLERWRASAQCSWQTRAQAMQTALAHQLRLKMATHLPAPLLD